ncbi:MAG: site-2 protease family protein [Planctomycetes bacterium]|nr:site-2 protease family protein [Planctomycetota bacterium]
MFFQTAFDDPLRFCAWILVVMISIIVHELAHGAMALRLGDDTPRLLGRMTFDPLVHMGALSLLLLVLFGIAFGSMPVDHRKLRGRYAGSWVALAGPAANFALAIVFGLALNALTYFGAGSASPVLVNVAMVLSTGLIVNVLLGLFNLIPIPPLDGYAALAIGSRAFASLTANEFFHRYAFLLLFVLLSTELGSGFYQAVFSVAATLRDLLPFSGA